MKGNRHGFKVWLRAFHIWQILGYNPWKSEWTVADRVPEGNVKGFYRGAFDSIPFLNDDAKRTFLHLLLRPGHMIRDYIKGKHDIYLAPLTSLIIFYAFFSLVSSIAHPDFQPMVQESGVIEKEADEPAVKFVITAQDSAVMHENEQYEQKAFRVGEFFARTDTLMHLDRYPEAIDSPRKASLAALEDALRSQGINLFLGVFLLLWPAMRITLRKYSMGWAASATAAAYVLCQFSFFMLFVLILSLGHKNDIGAVFMAVLVMIDYHQLLGTGFGRSLWLTVKTGLYWLLMYGLLILVLICGLVIYVLV